MIAPRAPISAEEFFTSREVKLYTAAEKEPAVAIWDVLEAEQDLLDGGKLDAESVLRSRTSARRLFFRGQSKQQHGLSSSLHRFLHEETGKPLTEQSLGSVELAIINDMVGRNLGRGMTKGELLMVLQHHGAPTRLMDVSDRPLEALFFAVQGNDATDGRLFILNLARDSPADEVDLSDSVADELPWTRHIRGDRAAADWTETVLVVKDRPLDARVIAQRGRFLVGGISRSYRNRNVTLEGRALSAVEFQQVSMLTIGFHKRRTAAKAWPAIGWTVRIPAATKPRLRELLDSRGINYETMFPDLSEAHWQSAEAGRTEIQTGFVRAQLRGSPSPD